MMITEAILALLFAVPSKLIDGISSLDIVLPEGALNGIANIIAAVGYVMPMEGLLPILKIGFAVEILHITIAIIVRIKSFVPTMGA